MIAQTGMPLVIAPPAAASLDDRIAAFEQLHALYRAKAAEPYIARGDRSAENPYAGLARATERVLARLRAQRQEPTCSATPSSTP